MTLANLEFPSSELVPQLLHFSLDSFEVLPYEYEGWSKSTLVPFVVRLFSIWTGFPRKHFMQIVSTGDNLLENVKT